MRTEVERLNGRLDRDYMFNDHFIRGLKKMEIVKKVPESELLNTLKYELDNWR